MGLVFTKLLGLAMAAGLVVGNADKIEEFYNELIATTQKVTTAGDMRSITMMLDYQYVKKGRYPRTDRFPQWMEENFKENQLRSLIQDNWGNELIYEASVDRKKFVLISKGSDGIRDTEDDMKITGP